MSAGSNCQCNSQRRVEGCLLVLIVDQELVSLPVSDSKQGLEIQPAHWKRSEQELVCALDQTHSSSDHHPLTPNFGIKFLWWWSFLGCTARYISSMVSSSLVILACCATISFTCDIIVPKSEAAKRKRKLQKSCSKQGQSQPVVHHPDR